MDDEPRAQASRRLRKFGLNFVRIKSAIERGQVDVSTLTARRHLNRQEAPNWTQLAAYCPQDLQRSCGYVRARSWLTMTFREQERENAKLAGSTFARFTRS